MKEISKFQKELGEVLGIQGTAGLSSCPEYRFLDLELLLLFTGYWIYTIHKEKKKEIDISIKINTKKKRILNCLSSLMYVEKGLNLYTLSIVLLELI